MTSSPSQPARPAGQAGRQPPPLVIQLAHDPTPENLKRWQELLIQDPPTSDQQLIEAFAPLMARVDWDPSAVFPGLLDGLVHLSIAPFILDLANHLARHGRVGKHPAHAHAPLLARLLGQLADRLSLLDERLRNHQADAETPRQVGHSVALAISCTDALALIGDPQATGALYKALEVPHRRLQAEVAYALSRLGEPAGRQRLVELSGEPIVRCRVLSYASELGMLDEIPVAMRSDESRAEGELVQFLAMATQHGRPPTRWELLDHRQLRWPGYDEPVDAYLFSYHYATDQGKTLVANRAIVGPCLRAPRINLSRLSIPDTFAYFAGWQAEHPDIRKLAIDQLTEAQRDAVDQLKRQIPSHFELDNVVLVGHFLDSLDVVCRARDTSSSPPSPPIAGTLVLSADGNAWFADYPNATALDPEDWYDVVKGRRLLTAFNPDFAVELDTEPETEPDHGDPRPSE